MEENTIFTKVRNMLEAHYPILYLTTFEYSRTKWCRLKSNQLFGTGKWIYKWETDYACIIGFRDEHPVF